MADTFLIVQRGEDIGRRYDLDTTQLTIGRGSDNDMVLNDPMVSRYHAVIKRTGGRIMVIDLGSSNPVMINDQVLDAGVPQQLQHRDVVYIGRTVFSFQNRAQSGAPARPQPAEREPVGSRGGTGGQGEQRQSRDNDWPTPPPPTLERAMPPSHEDEGKTVISSGPSHWPTDTSDNERTMIGTESAERQTPPPPPPPLGGWNQDNAATTPPGLGRPPIASVPPLPSFNEGGNQLIGTPPSDEEGDLPTQIIPPNRR